MTRRDGVIVAGPDDDDLDPNAPDDDDELDDDDGEPQAPPAQQGPTREELLAEIQRLRRGNTRNNRELAKTRQVAAWMKKNGITDLDQWLADQQQPPGGTGEVSGSPTETLGTPPGHVDNPPAPPAPPVPSETEIQRRVQLELERRQAQEDERVDKLTQSLRASAIQAALSNARFSGTVATALKVIDQSKIEVDSDGNVTGVDEAVQELRAEIPEWFRRASPPPTNPTRNGGAVDGGEKRPPAAKARRWEDQIVDRWKGGR